MPVTFNPGPSQISAATVSDIQELAASGLLSVSHRTTEVRELVLRCLRDLRRVMAIPDDYAIVFQPSATAAMDLVLGNCTQHTSAHFVAGAFADRFATTAQRLGRTVTRLDAPWGAAFDVADVAFETPPELIAVTHNETSTGAMWPAEALRALRDAHPEPLLAVDVTSSFGALAMDWTCADFWFGSVQKCLGLPSGLGLSIVGPRARARICAGSRAAWRDLAVLLEMIDRGDTVETPNMLAIALLGRQMARWDLAAVEAATRACAAQVHEAFGDAAFFVRDPAWRSPTVHNLVVDDPAACHVRAEAAGFVLGKGYGKLRERCIRIATFPAHTSDDVARLLASL